MTSPAAYVLRRIDLLARIRRLLIEHLQLRMQEDEIDPDTPLFGTGLGLDSIDAVDLVIAVETEFGVPLGSEQSSALVHLRTVNTLVDVVLEGTEGLR